MASTRPSIKSSSFQDCGKMLTRWGSMPSRLSTARSWMLPCPSESITLAPYCYHKFWGVGGRVLVGEVSKVNDDNTDNRFLEPVGRFPAIEEDEVPLHLLVNDYGRYYRPGR